MIEHYLDFANKIESTPEFHVESDPATGRSNHDMTHDSSSRPIVEEEKLTKLPFMMTYGNKLTMTAKDFT